MIQELHYVTFPELTDAYTMVGEIGLHLSTDRRYVGAFVAEHFAKVLGDFQEAELLRQKAHLIDQANAGAHQMTVEEAHYWTHVQVVRSQLFQQALWLVKDNSVNAGRVYFAARNNAGGDKWTHDTPPHWFFTAKCLLEDTSFSKAELDEAIALYRNFSEVRSTQPYDPYFPGLSASAIKSRVGRCFYAIRSARAVDDPGLKVAFYCIALEALVSTSNKQVARRMGERVATLLGTSDDDKRSIYDDVQVFYDRRSRVVHGDHLDDEATSELFTRMPEWDGYLRKMLRLILNDSALFKMFTDANKVDIDEYFRTRPFPK